MRHIGSLCKLIDYLKAVEFFTLKTSQCKKEIMLFPKSISFQCLHRSRIFYIIKFNMNFLVTIIGPIFITTNSQLNRLVPLRYPALSEAGLFINSTVGCPPLTPPPLLSFPSSLEECIICWA